MARKNDVAVARRGRSGRTSPSQEASALGPDEAQGVATLRHNDDLLARMVRRAEADALAGRYSSALAWCWAAAEFAMTNPTGRLRSGDLERVLDLVAARALQTLRQTPPSPTSGRLRVLHVLTEAASIGGLTRLAERWIRHDASSLSSVAITRQWEPAPSLASAVAESGGHVTALGDGDPVDRAARLRQLAVGADVVICHLQPADPVTAVAFGAGYHGAPVAVFNHADHLFLVAPTHASGFIDFRQVGALLSHTGRGYSPELTHRLPLLVPDTALPLSRDSTRSALGVASDAVVALSVARAVKFCDTEMRPRFSWLVANALERHPQLVLCVVGPTSQDEPWPPLRERFPGRILITGPVPDPAVYFAAADLYLDTFPFSSLTSLLEASAAGLPVLTYDGHEGLRRALGIADFVATAADRPSDEETYFARLAELVGDADVRSGRGANARKTFLRLTPEESWLGRVHALYTAIANASQHGIALGATAAPEPDEALMDYGLALLAVELRVPLSWTMAALASRLPRRDRHVLSARILAVRGVRKAASIMAANPPAGADHLFVARNVGRSMRRPGEVGTR